MKVMRSGSIAVLLSITLMAALFGVQIAFAGDDDSAASAESQASVEVQGEAEDDAVVQDEPETEAVEDEAVVSDEAAASEEADPVEEAIPSEAAPVVEDEQASGEATVVEEEVNSAPAEPAVVEDGSAAVENVEPEAVEPQEPEKSKSAIATQATLASKVKASEMTAGETYTATGNVTITVDEDITVASITLTNGELTIVQDEPKKKSDVNTLKVTGAITAKKVTIQYAAVTADSINAETEIAVSGVEGTVVSTKTAFQATDKNGKITIKNPLMVAAPKNAKVSGGKILETDGETAKEVTIEYAEYTVSFKTAHGTAPADQVIARGGNASKPAALTASDWYFAGWFTSETGSTAYDFATEVTEDTTVYAQWIELTRHARVEPTCTTAGNIEYWDCVVDSKTKYFTDATAQTAIKKSATVLAAKGHTLTHVAAVSSTPTANGNIEYWYCTTCQKYLADDDKRGTNEIPNAPQSLTFRYTITAGANASWTKGSTSGLTIAVARNYNDNNTLAHFNKGGSVQVNGSTVDSSRYTITQTTSGIQVVLKSTYLETLSAGTQTVRINFEDGYTATNITVRAAANSSTNSNNGSSANKTPATGDELPIVPIVGVIVVSIAVAAVALVARRRTR